MFTITNWNSELSHRQFRMNFARLGLFALFLALVFYFIFMPLNKAAASADSTAYTQDQLDALEMLNEVRLSVGLPPVKLNKEITQAAINHAKYYNLHERGKKVTLSAHQEKMGLEGFTGTGPFERMKAAGWNYGTSYRTGEDMHFGQKSSTMAMQSWLDTAYHRDIILGSAYNEIGIALVDGTAVVNLGGSYQSSMQSNRIFVYPYQGMTNVPVGFYGNEVPNPLDQFNVEHSGYIISASVSGKLDWHEASITDEKGNNVPFYEEVSSGRTLFLYPKSILQSYHTYRVNLAYRTDSSSETQHLSWSFKTGKGHQLVSISGVAKEILINEGEETSIKMTGRYDDNAMEPLTDQVRYVSSNAAGLKLVSTATFKGIKAGNYYVTAHVGNLSSERIQVKVLPRLKTKTYPPLNASKPASTVTEAEFWMMFLQQYQIHIEAYAPSKQKHAADAAYRIAEMRNIPLLGLTSIPARDKPITRGKVAEIIAAADGVHYVNYNAIWYVLGMNYMKGTTDSTLTGFEPDRTMTRGEAVQLLTELKPKLKSLRARPASRTPVEFLPPLPEREVYIKPEVIKDYTLIATYHPDRTLTVEGKFTILAGQQTTMMVQTGGKKPKQIEDVTVSVDREGNFKVTSGPYTEDSLNLDLKTPGVTYWISVEANAMNVSEYTPKP
ncbi:CAP domain-containing protein [Paenibacillus alvei]|uniref:CAP domain-containing protein n=1 Tax=Paenibacillus alvei TaxID=44250 RepID=UPI0022816F61|nr:CAP domain-containing protein [Paenibacillus alvei]